MTRRYYLGRLTLLVLTGFFVALPFLIPAQAAADSNAERESLKGLRGVAVVVLAAPEAEQGGLSQATLQTDVELKLRQAGIRVLTSTERPSAPGAPILVVTLGTTRSPAGFYAYAVTVGLAQHVYLARDPTMGAWATTWTTGSVGYTGQARMDTIRSVVRDYVDRFLNAYLAVNPKE
jgi:hypothetical protein